MGTPKRIMWALVIVVVFTGVGFANWADSFDGGNLTLTTWQFAACPDVMKTYKGFTKTADDGNGYLVLQETSPSDIPTLLGAAFGAAFGSPEKFKDVRVGAVVNVNGVDCQNIYGLLARCTYFVDPDGKLSGLAPGFFADGYIMFIGYKYGPANLWLELQKIKTNQHVMDKDIDVMVPRLENARSYYAELEVLGAGPVYVTGRLYEFKGGPLVAQTPTMVDTDAKDWWEDAGPQEKVFTEGVSAVFADNEDPVPVGFYTTWDDISSVSDGPTAVLMSPADGATGVAMNADMSWVEAAFATDREVWFGPAGNMQLVSPNPAKGSFDPGLLQAGTTYEWRVDQVGAKGAVQGHSWRFTTGGALAVDDFESYADSAAIAAAWPHNITGYDYIFLETGTIRQGAKAMKFTYQNGADPFITEATRTFATAQDWTIGNPTQLSMDFRGVKDNVEQPLYVIVEDDAGNTARVAHPAAYAVQSEPWRTWDIDLADFAGVDLAAVKKVTLGTGSGSDSGQASGDVDTLYIDDVRLKVAP
ncbi:MAG: hypothetical protein JW955_14040 [Sedimentisphaerales bacterium]|nr:hypothetical protein [Sedimentisphaerales bacterium]